MQVAIDAPPLYRASVPVLIAVLERIADEIAKAQVQLGPAFAAALEQRPAPGMMTAARQVATAIQFTQRIAHPLADRRTPELRGPLDAAGLIARAGAARRHLTALPPKTFLGAETRIVRAQAGLAHLELPGEAYLYEFGLPNLYFHQAMAHVALKQAGATLGKADFDGKHHYPEGYSLG